MRSNGIFFSFRVSAGFVFFFSRYQSPMSMIEIANRIFYARNDTRKCIVNHSMKNCQNTDCDDGTMQLLDVFCARNCCYLNDYFCIFILSKIHTLGMGQRLGGLICQQFRQSKIITRVYRENDDCWNRSDDSSSSFIILFFLFGIHIHAVTDTPSMAAARKHSHIQRTMGDMNSALLDTFCLQLTPSGET